MSLHELIVNRGRNGCKIEPTALLCHSRVEYNLKQQVAELGTQLPWIAARNCVGDLVGLLDRKGCDRGEGLLTIPRTAFERVTQPLHQLQQRGHRAFSLTHRASPPDRGRLPHHRSRTSDTDSATFPPSLPRCCG